MVSQRRQEAQRSIVVEIACEKSVEAVWQQCSTIGTVSALMYYSTYLKNVNKKKVISKLVYS